MKLSSDLMRVNLSDSESLLLMVLPSLFTDLANLSPCHPAFSLLSKAAGTIQCAGKSTMFHTAELSALWATASVKHIIAMLIGLFYSLFLGFDCLFCEFQ